LPSSTAVNLFSCWESLFTFKQKAYPDRRRDKSPATRFPALAATDCRQAGHSVPQDRQIFYLAGNGSRVDDIAASKSGMRASGFHVSGNYFE
jgi:hypothetical protein